LKIQEKNFTFPKSNYRFPT